MSYVVFFIVLAAACFLISRVPFIKKSGLGSRLIVCLFLFKIFAGLAQAWITRVYFPGSDTWAMNDWSYIEYQLLLKDPVTFFRELYVSNYNGSGYNNLFGSFGSFWNDLELNLLTKGLAPFNFISQGNYYINGIFFNFFGFFGHIALFRLFTHMYKVKKYLLLAGCFLLPSFLFFSSAIGKDNLAFTMLAMFCFCLYFFTLDGFSLKRWLWLLLFFLAVLLMRNHIALLLIPPAIAFYISTKKHTNAWRVFAITTVVLIGLLLIVPLIIPAMNAAAIISNKQQDFLALGVANSQVNITPLEPSATGLLKNLPEAVAHGFFRPYPTDISNFFTLAEALEIVLIILLFLSALYFSVRSRSHHPVHPFVLFAAMFCCMVFIMNGYIVPNFNTLVRYRSIYLPLIVIPMLCKIPAALKPVNTLS